MAEAVTAGFSPEVPGSLSVHVRFVLFKVALQKVFARITNVCVKTVTRDTNINQRIHVYNVSAVTMSHHHALYKHWHRKITKPLLYEY